MMNTERVRGSEKEWRRKTGERKEKEEGVGKRQQSTAPTFPTAHQDASERTTE